MARILHLSDIHFGGENPAATAAAAAFAGDGVNELIVISGDVTLDGRPGEFEAAKAWIDALPSPVLITPGNHDTPYTVLGVLERAISPFARYERALGPAWSGEFESEAVSVRAFNTARGVQLRLNWSKGAVSADHVRTVADALSASDGKLRIAVCHHPLIEVVGGPMTARVRGGAGAAQILTQGVVDLVLTGHVHTPFALPLPCGDELTYAVGAGTLSLRERGMPPSFNVIEWDEEAVRVTAQGWSGSVYEPLRTWVLPRRKAPLRRRPSSADRMHDQRDNEQGDEDHRKNLGDIDGRAGDAAEA